MLQLLQGVDSPLLEIQIFDANGMLIPLSQMDDYQIYIYSIDNDDNKKLAITYMKDPVPGTYPIIASDTYNQGFIIPRAETIRMSPGSYYAESKIKLSSTTYWQSSEQNIGNDGWEVCQIIQSAQPKLMK